MDTPANIEAEMSVLGRMIRFGDRAHEIACKLRDEHFHSARHKVIFSELCKIAQTCAPNIQIISSRLESQADVIGRAYLEDLCESVVSMVGTDAEISLITDAHKRRQMIDLSKWALAQAHESDDTEAMLSGAVAKISDIVNGSGGSRSGFSHAASNLDSVLSDELPRETPTGLPWFDSLYTTIS